MLQPPLESPFGLAMRERGTDFGRMLARQPWNRLFSHDFLDSIFQHRVSEKQDTTSFWRPTS